jgi:hypothetical protein
MHSLAKAVQEHFSKLPPIKIETGLMRAKALMCRDLPTVDALIEEMSKAGNVQPLPKSIRLNLQMGGSGTRNDWVLIQKSLGGPFIFSFYVYEKLELEPATLELIQHACVSVRPDSGIDLRTGDGVAGECNGDPVQVGNPDSGPYEGQDGVAGNSGNPAGSVGPLDFTVGHSRSRSFGRHAGRFASRQLAGAGRHRKCG